MVIIGDEILENSANEFPSSADTIRRNDRELVYKFSVKNGFFFCCMFFLLAEDGRTIHRG